jgi:hypothetical protein
MPAIEDKQEVQYQQVVKALDQFGEKNIMEMDPKLQQAIILRRSGVKGLTTVAASTDEIAVLAKVNTFEEWEQCSDVRAPTAIVPALEGGGQIVTGRIPISRIEAIRKLPFVKSLKAARKLRPTLQRAPVAMDLPAQPASTTSFKGGKGVLVGIVDTGCDFAHRNFQLSGKTRLRKFWDQSAKDELPGGLPGKIYTADQINAALKKADPYKALGYRPGDRAHGTHVMDIAAGNGKGTGTPGIAPEAELIFVHVFANDIAWQGQGVIEESFGDSVNLVEAIKFIFTEAGDQPCVINISLGTNGGPHDGTTLVEESIDSFIAQKTNRCVVIAASNSYTDGIHATGQIAAGATFDLPWVVHPGDPTENELDLWYPKSASLSMEVIAPDGKSLGTIGPGETGTVDDAAGSTRIAATNRKRDSGNGDNNIGVWMSANQGGQWVIRLKNIGTVSTTFHAWVERDDDGQSNFGTAHDAQCTLGSISCAKTALTVGSYDATVNSLQISSFSSSGPTRDGREKPEIAAPGSKVKAARSQSVTGAYADSGTSMASPAVTGAVALLYEQAIRLGKQVDIQTLRSFVVASGQLTPPAQVWDKRYGYGRLSVKKLLEHLKPAAGSGTVAAASTVRSAKKKGKTTTKSKKPIAVNKKAAKKSSKKK